MPLAVESRDVALGNGRAAAFAFQGEHGQVILFAVRFAVLLLESVLAELASALRAEKVVRMPRLIQRRHAFLMEPHVQIVTRAPIRIQSRESLPKDTTAVRHRPSIHPTVRQPPLCENQQEISIFKRLMRLGD